METKQNTLLSNFTEQEKTAYITALAALATSDREASDEELENLREVSHSAGLSADHEETIMRAAQDTSGQELIKSLDVL